MSSKEYYQANKEKIKQKAKEYYSANKDAVLENVKQYRDSNRETIKEKGREYYRRKLKNRILNAAKARARKFGYEFNITEEDVIIPKYCPLLGVEMFVAEGRQGSKKNSFSLDRIDSTKGYIKGNVWVISMLANSMKSDGTFDDFQRMAENWRKYHENGYDISGLEQTEHS